MLNRLLFVVLLVSSVFSPGLGTAANAEQPGAQPPADNQPQAEQRQNTVRYNKQQDTLNMAVSEMSLKRVLALIAMQSHIEVLFDDRADQPVTMSFEDAPLQKALENLLRGSSYAFRYTRDSNDKALLIGVTVLPDSEAGDGNALPLLHAAGEAYTYTRKNRLLSAEEMAKQETYNQRWQARLAEMPPAVREKVIQHANERLAKQDKKKAKRKAKKEERKQKREAKKAEREAKWQERLQAMTPEERALAEQRRENAKRMAIERAQQTAAEQ